MTRWAQTTLKIAHCDLIRASAAGKRVPLPDWCDWVGSSLKALPSLSEWMEVPASLCVSLIHAFVTSLPFTGKCARVHNSWKKSWLIQLSHFCKKNSEQQRYKQGHRLENVRVSVLIFCGPSEFMSLTFFLKPENPVWEWKKSSDSSPFFSLEQNGFNVTEVLRCLLFPWTPQPVGYHSSERCEADKLVKKKQNLSQLVANYVFVTK